MSPSSALRALASLRLCFGGEVFARPRVGGGGGPGGGGGGGGGAMLAARQTHFYMICNRNKLRKISKCIKLTFFSLNFFYTVKTKIVL